MLVVLTACAAAAVVAAEFALRRRVNAAPDAQFPKPLGRHFELRRAHNTGLVGSRLADRPKLVLAWQTAASVAAVGAAAALNLTAPTAKLAHLGAGLVVGGAVSNLAERLRCGAVTDYVHGVDAPLRLLNRRIWNLADMAVFNGCVLTIVGVI